MVVTHYYYPIFHSRNIKHIYVLCSCYKLENQRFTCLCEAEATLTAAWDRSLFLVRSETNQSYAALWILLHLVHLLVV